MKYPRSSVGEYGRQDMQILAAKSSIMKLSGAGVNLGAWGRQGRSRKHFRASEQSKRRGSCRERTRAAGQLQLQLILRDDVPASPSRNVHGPDGGR